MVGFGVIVALALSLKVESLSTSPRADYGTCKNV